MDASQRSRCPSVLELFDKLQSLTEVDDRDEHLWTVWFHFLQIANFIGNVEFVNRFLLDRDPIERCMFKKALANTSSEQRTARTATCSHPQFNKLFYGNEK